MLLTLRLSFVRNVMLGFKNEMLEFKDDVQDFKGEMKKLFRSDDSMYNWGVYRIINQKNQEIDKFIDTEIPKILDDCMVHSAERDVTKKDEELEKIKSACETAGTDYKDNEKYKAIKAEIEKLKTEGVSKDRIYNDLINFFKRYFENGDFISNFYFKEDEYVVPYDGSETYFHWATKDQYYVKTSDEFRRLSVNAGDANVVFSVSKTEEAKNNEKTKCEYFKLDEEKPFDWDEENREFRVNLLYVPKDEDIEKLGGKKTEWQDKLDGKTSEDLCKKLAELKLTLAEDHIKKTLKNLRKRYTEDFFIHKNLGGFLSKELKYFILNDVLDVNSLVGDETIRGDALVRADAIKQIAGRIITRLTAIEDLKKKVWEKKKFVLETNYVITLDKLAQYTSDAFVESISDAIVANKGQVQEWKDLFSLEIKKKADLYEAQKKVSSGKEWKKLPIDTKYFVETDLKDRILIEISRDKSIDEVLDGLLIKSENWQALNLLQEKYSEKIRCCYIDPPYNTGSDGFIYKDLFQESSWLSMMNSRLELGRDLLRPSGTLFINIDDNELHNLKVIADTTFGVASSNKSNFVQYIEVKSNEGAANEFQNPFMPKNCEYLLNYAKDYDSRIYKPIWSKSEQVDEAYNKIILNPEVEEIGIVGRHIETLEEVKNSRNTQKLMMPKGTN